MSDKKLAVFFPGIGYTNDKPLEATFFADMKVAIAFIGEEDPWSDLNEVKRLAAQKHVPLYIYPGCNHSLECSSWKRNMEIVGKVMELTETYMPQTVHRIMDSYSVIEV